MVQITIHFNCTLLRGLDYHLFFCVKKLFAGLTRIVFATKVVFFLSLARTIALQTLALSLEIFFFFLLKSPFAFAFAFAFAEKIVEKKEVSQCFAASRGPNVIR